MFTIEEELRDDRPVLFTTDEEEGTDRPVLLLLMRKEALVGLCCYY